MKTKKNTGFTIPWLTIILLLISAAVILWGWTVLIYVFAIAILIPLLTWLYDNITLLRGRCPGCLAAKAFLQSQHPTWKVWIEPRSHISTESQYSTVAVFYQDPGGNMPPSYKIFAVQHGSHAVTELPHRELPGYDFLWS